MKPVRTHRKLDLDEDLRKFAAARPQGWDHHDWEVFLDHLAQRGHDVQNPEAIGAQLERERLASILDRISGMGPRRTEALVERYQTLWNLRQASVEELAGFRAIPRSLAERIYEEVH